MCRLVQMMIKLNGIDSLFADLPEVAGEESGMIGDGKATVSLVHFCDLGFYLEQSLFLGSVSKLDVADP